MKHTIYFIIAISIFVAVGLIGYYLLSKNEVTDPFPDNAQEVTVNTEISEVKSGATIEVNAQDRNDREEQIMHSLETATKIEHVSSTTYRYTNSKLGLTFEYPKNHGMKIRYDVEIGNCPDSVNDDCAMIRTYAEESTREWRKLFAVSTKSYWDYSIGKGGDWVTESMKYVVEHENFEEICSNNRLEECRLFHNDYGLEYIGYYLDIFSIGNFQEIYVVKSPGTYALYVFGGHAIRDRTVDNSNTHNHPLEIRTLRFIDDE